MMNGSAYPDLESDKTSDTSFDKFSDQASNTSLEEEEPESVTPTCDALAHIANVMSEKTYEPTVPNALTKNYLQKAGMCSPDPALVNLISVVAQKFISDIASDALAHHKMRPSPSNKNKRKDNKLVMNTEDLRDALEDKGITVRRQPYY